MRNYPQTEYNVLCYSSVVTNKAEREYRSPSGGSKKLILHGLEIKKPLELPKAFSENWVYLFKHFLPQHIEVVKKLRNRFPKLKIVTSFCITDIAMYYPLILPEETGAPKELVGELKKIPIYLLGSYFFGSSPHSVFFNQEDEKKTAQRNYVLNKKITMDYILAPPSRKLYVLCAPTGFGKSTIQEHLSNICARTLPKITTRPYRSLSEMRDGNIQFVTPRLFQTMASEGLILAPHIYNNNAYGLAASAFEEVSSDKYDAYLWDTCDPESALALRKQHPDRVRVIGIFPKFSFAGAGLERRITGLSIKMGDLNETPPGLLKKEQAILNTKKRLERIMSETRDYRQFLPEFDRVLEGETLYDNISQMVDVICEDKR